MDASMEAELGLPLTDPVTLVVGLGSASHSKFSLDRFFCPSMGEAWDTTVAISCWLMDVLLFVFDCVDRIDSVCCDCLRNPSIAGDVPCLPAPERTGVNRDQSAS